MLWVNSGNSQEKGRKSKMVQGYAFACPAYLVSLVSLVHPSLRSWEFLEEPQCGASPVETPIPPLFQMVWAAAVAAVAVAWKEKVASKMLSRLQFSLTRRTLPISLSLVKLDQMIDQRELRLKRRLAGHLGCWAGPRLVQEAIAPWP